MDISIVSGTYNRIESVKRMVDSVRKSLEFPIKELYGFSYEIVLVDGGSQDGTIQWAREQKDIVLVEHGELLGAVKAFNDGAKIAKGDWVILGNDDIEFVDDSIYKAWIFASSIENIGMGCFYQNRNQKDWHVETMPVVVDEKQSALPYGQVCIVPKWLGDKVGWWGDYLHTYGGDNELSSNIYESGFKIIPFSECRIKDHEINDGLRKINNIDGQKDPRSVKGHHPDSWAWGRKWRRKGLVGPIVQPKPFFESQTPKRTKILYLPIFEQGWQVQKQQKRGLREAFINNNFIVKELDYIDFNSKNEKNSLIEYLTKLLIDFKPDLIITQLHNSDILNGNDISELKKLYKVATWVNWNGDVWPQNLQTDEGRKLNKQFDLVGLVNKTVIKEYNQIGINSFYWQIGWEPDGVGFEPIEDKHFSDIVYLASGYSNSRRKLVENLRNSIGKKYKFSLWGPTWPEGWSLGQTIYDFKEGCRLYRGAKISLGDSQWPETGFVSNRVFQALSAGGSVLAHQWFFEIEELGLIDGKTCIIWKTVEELIEKIDYYLNPENEEERKQIAKNGQNLALEKHSFGIRVKELLNRIENKDKIINEEVEDWR